MLLCNRKVLQLSNPDPTNRILGHDPSQTLKALVCKKSAIGNVVLKIRFLEEGLGWDEIG